MAVTREWRWVLLSLVLLALLAWLSAAQYRGIASITDAERGRLRASAQARANEMARAFDAEITRAYVAFYRPPIGHLASGDPAATAAQELSRYRATSRYPRLVRQLLLLAFRPGGTSLRHVRPDGVVEPAGWPSEFGSWSSRFSGPGGTQQSLNLTGFLLADVPAFVVPLTNVNVTPPSAGSRIPVSASVSFAGFLFGWLDRPYLEHEFIPSLVQRFFSRSDGYDYHVAVVAPKEKNRFVYLSDGSPRSIFDTPDVHAAMFQVRFDELMQAASGGARSPLPFRSDPEAGEWQVRLVHRAGSLDRAVGIVRRWNMAVSFGAMVLLAASAAFLVISTRRAQHLARQQMVFVAGVSHELRTPLTVIRTAGENLSDGVIVDPAQVKHYGSVIAEEGQRLTEMVEQVMAYAGFEAGRDLSDRTVVSVEQLIEEAVEGSRIEDSGCRLERHIPPGLPLVRVNVPAMRQAIENLLVNAVKYGGPDRWVRVAAECSPDGRQLRLMVSDSGAGVKPDEQRRIFEPFYRSRDVVGTAIRGSGLGLSLAMRIVTAHGGTIGVRSFKGQPTTFSIQLPIEQAASAEVQA